MPIGVKEKPKIYLLQCKRILPRGIATYRTEIALPANAKNYIERICQEWDVSGRLYLYYAVVTALVRDAGFPSSYLNDIGIIMRRAKRVRQEKLKLHRNRKDYVMNTEGLLTETGFLAKPKDKEETSKKSASIKNLLDLFGDIDE